MSEPQNSRPLPVGSDHGDLGFDLPEPTRVSSGKVVLVVVLAVGVLAAAFVASYLPRRSAARALAESARAATSALPTLAVLRPKLVSNERAVVLPGSVRPLEEAVIYPRANGYVSRWLVDLGAKVKAGDLLAEIDTPELDQELGQARAAYARAVAAKAQAEAGRVLARSTFERTGKLVDAGISSQQELEQTQAQSAVGDADVNVAQAAVEAERANIRRLSDLREFSRVTAPFAGTIVQRSIERGSLVSAGNATPLFRLAATDTVRVFVQVPQDVASSVTVGTRAIVTVGEFSGRNFEGHVAHTAGALEAATRTLNAEVRVDNADGKLFAGMYAEVSLRLTSPRRVFELPATALISDASGLRVAIVRADGTLHLQPIGVDRDLGATLMISTGLDGSEDVVQIANADLHEGQRVKSVPGKAPPSPRPSGAPAPPATSSAGAR